MVLKLGITTNNWNIKIKIPTRCCVCSSIAPPSAAVVSWVLDPTDGIATSAAYPRERMNHVSHGGQANIVERPSARRQRRGRLSRRMRARWRVPPLCAGLTTSQHRRRQARLYICSRSAATGASNLPPTASARAIIDHRRPIDRRQTSDSIDRFSNRGFPEVLVLLAYFLT